MSTPIKIGIVGTLAWAFIIGALFSVDAVDLALMRPNELGDFLAGAVAPLAFLWLVVTVFQQHLELKLNTKALELQAEELKHQVEETRALAQHAARQAKVAEESLAREREAARPRLQLAIKSRTPGGELKLALVCGAQPAYRVEIEPPVLPDRIEIVSRGKEKILTIQSVFEHRPEIPIVVRCEDGIGNRYRYQSVYLVDEHSLTQLNLTHEAGDCRALASKEPYGSP